MTPKSCRICGATTKRASPFCPDCEFMTQPEAIHRLRVSRSTFLRMVAAGKIHPRRIGIGRGKLLVRRAEVEAILG
jgi:excisionase family DNA binding protein